MEGNKVIVELEGNKVLAEVVPIHSDYLFISPYGTTQENKEVEG